MSNIEKTLNAIVVKLDNLDRKVEELSALIPRVDQLTDKVDQLSELKPKVAELSGLKSKVEELYALIPKIEESHQWIRILVENKELKGDEWARVGIKFFRVDGGVTGLVKGWEVLKKAQ